MLLGVISDTHGQLDVTKRAVRLMQQHGVEQVLHCGDVGGAAVVRLFQPFAAHFVVGNCDNPATLQLAVEAAGQVFHGRVGELSLHGRHIAFLHGDSHFAIQRHLAENHWDLIAHGHTHLAECYSVGQTLILNPGAMMRCEQPSIALVRLPSLEVTHVPLALA